MTEENKYVEIYEKQKSELNKMDQIFEKWKNVMIKEVESFEVALCRIYGYHDINMNKKKLPASVSVFGQYGVIVKIPVWFVYDKILRKIVCNISSVKTVPSEFWTDDTEQGKTTILNLPEQINKCDMKDILLEEKCWEIIFKGFVGKLEEILKDLAEK